MAVSRVPTRCSCTTTRTRPRPASGTTRRISTTRSRVTRKLTLNVGVRYRPLLQLPARAGQSGHRAVRDDEHLPVSGREQLPDLLDVRAARVGGLRPHRRRPRRACARATAATSAAARARRQTRARARPTSIRTRSSRGPTTNWDGSIPYVPIAANLASTSGGGTEPHDRSRTSRGRSSMNTPPVSTSV